MSSQLEQLKEQASAVLDITRNEDARGSVVFTIKNRGGVARDVSVRVLTPSDDRSQSDPHNGPGMPSKQLLQELDRRIITKTPEKTPFTLGNGQEQTFSPGPTMAKEDLRNWIYGEGKSWYIYMAVSYRDTMGSQHTPPSCVWFHPMRDQFQDCSDGSVIQLMEKQK